MDIDQSTSGDEDNEGAEAAQRSEFLAGRMLSRMREAIHSDPDALRLSNIERNIFVRDAAVGVDTLGRHDVY